MAITMDGITFNGQKVTFRPEDILSEDASVYTEEIGAAVEAWLEENVTGGEQVTDTTLTLPGVPADAKKTGDEIADLKEDLNAIQNEVYSSAPEYVDCIYRMGGLKGDGDPYSSQPVERIRCSDTSLIPISAGDFVFCDENYEIRIGIYNDNATDASVFVAFTDTTFANGYVSIPETYIGKYANILIRKIGYEDSNISADLATIKAHVKYYSVRKAFDKIDNLENELFIGDNNLFVLEDKESEYYHGLTVKIENGVITASCTSLSSAVYLKLTNGFVFAQSEPSSWYSESVDIFEVGKTYSMGYKVVSGEMPSTIGTPFRHSKVSTLSATIPTAKITAENFPQYCQLYVPKATTNLSVSFYPYVVEGYIDDHYEKAVNPNLNILPSKKIPAAEFNYFTVSVNPYIPNSTSDATINQDNESNLVDTQCVVTFPRTYTADGKPTPIIMYGHGRTDTVSVDDWVENNADRLALVRAFTNAGYAVFDIDSTDHTNNVDVGCPQIMEGYRKAFEYIKANYNVEDRFCIYSYSFGTFPALNMLAWNPSLVKTACLSAVRASVKAVFDRGTPFNAEIAQKFGFTDTTGVTYEADKLLGYDMYADMVDIDGTDRIFVKIPPIKVLTSDADTLELTQAHTFINALKNGGNSVTHREVSGLSHVEMCLLDTSGLKEEVIMWFNRFK